MLGLTKTQRVILGMIMVPWPLVVYVLYPYFSVRSDKIDLILGATFIICVLFLFYSITEEE
jgi:hypothetical protein